MALAMPSDGFDGYSVLTPRVAGYYATHWIVFFGSLSLCGFGLYRPNMKDVLPTLLSALCVSLVIFGVDVLMRRTGINEHANYFYLMETEGNAILEAFHSLIPVPYLYILPCFGILAPYILIVTAGFALADRKRR